MLVLALALAALPQDRDLERALRSRDVETRLEAVRTIAASPTEHAEDVVRALEDDDWEIVELAARAAGELGTAASEKARDELLELALEGPVRRVRAAAAASLGAIEPIETYRRLARPMRREDEALRALEAVVAMGPDLASRVEPDPILRALDAKEPQVRRAASRALVVVALERGRWLEDRLEQEDVAVRSAAVEAAGAFGGEEVVDPLVDVLERESLEDVVERRVHAALRAVAARDRAALAALERRVEALVDRAEEGAVPARVARLLARLGEERADGGEEARRVLPAGTAVARLEALLGRGPAVRRAALDALGQVGTAEALARIAPLATDDPDARVRRVALVTLERAGEDGAGLLREAALQALATDPDATVREVAAAALGVLGAEEVVEPLTRALADEDWRVVLAAAVSIGKTETPGAVPTLIELHASEDWRVRGAAVVGLVELRSKEGVPTVIAALDDSEPLVRRTAYEFLCKLAAHRDIDPERRDWEEWWELNGDRLRLSLPEEVRRRRAELAYVDDPRVLYDGLDVMILESRGDRVEDLFAFVGLDHRMTRTGALIDDGVHPGGVFVSNCDGVILEEEAERLSWFVRSGGYLFGSCWALRETIEKVAPGYVRKARTGGQVLGDVPAYPVDPASPRVEGVFAPNTRPIYHLEGAHLIEVIEPELVEVLVDSPEAAARWGSGNLAAWFPVGHGIVLDSANHFHAQGLATAVGLDGAEERMAYAVDHLGYSYADLRATRREAFWKRLSSAAERVKDLSVFRLVTNFVREKRLAGHD